jgi:hypothetical protein
MSTKKLVNSEIVFEKGEIMVRHIILELHHMLYCDSPPSQNLATTLGICVEDTIIQRLSQFGGVIMKTSRV